MFKKILIANRGEIAVRIIQTCREMDISTVAVYEAPDQESLHVRQANESVLLDTEQGFLDQENLLKIATETGADAIHPGYGFLAEKPEFIQACKDAGITFIGPVSLPGTTDCAKLDVLNTVREAGFPTVAYAEGTFEADDLEGIGKAAEALGYPIIVKSCVGGRGRGERFVFSADELERALYRASTEANAVYGSDRLYLEKAVDPANQVGVQIIADGQDNIIHLGEREGSLIFGNQKVFEETPAPCLTGDQRAKLLQTAVEIARVLGYQNIGSVEFLVDGDGKFYFTEMKSRIQVNHPLTEMVSQVDLVREQIRIAAGEPLDFSQSDVNLNGHTMLFTIKAQDYMRRLMPTPGQLQQVRLPSGPGVRVDTHISSGYAVPADYDPLLAKLTVWGPDRETCLKRMQRALKDVIFTGTVTNMPLLQRIIYEQNVVAGTYDSTVVREPDDPALDTEKHLRDLAVAAAVMFAQQRKAFEPSVPERLNQGWHRTSRKLPTT